MKPTRTIAITSGKRDVGKTNIATNLAIALKQLGEEVMIFDANLGVSNVDLLLGLKAKYNIHHIINGQKRLKDVIIEGPHGIKILSAGSGVRELIHLDNFQQLRILEEFEDYQGEIDTLILDTGTGISSDVAFFCNTAQDIIVILSPEPAALTSGCDLIKVLFTQYQEKQFKILINLANSASEALAVFKHLSEAVEKFLQVSLDYLGFLPKDDSLQRAVKAQRSFLDVYPDSTASKSILELAFKLKEDSKNSLKGSMQLFLGRLIGGVRDVWI
ncbi:MAG: MinD/ParA family protein [Deltaproteobacteria bacterium]|nr:MinD/ParA family protein [Deltaproteobacteria bacterium]